MECPVCDDVSLSISSREGIEIDFCPKCRGVWLDRGELDKIIERAAVVGAPPPVSVAPAPRVDDAPDRYRDERYGRDRDDRDRDDRDRDDRDRDRDDRYRGDDRSRRRKRGGFLEDLFDFD